MNPGVVVLAATTAATVGIIAWARNRNKPAAPVASDAEHEQMRQELPINRLGQSDEGMLYVGIVLDIPDLLHMATSTEYVEEEMRNNLPHLVRRVKDSCPGAPQFLDAARFRVDETDEGFFLKIWVPARFDGNTPEGPVAPEVFDCIRTTLANELPRLAGYTTDLAVLRV